MFRFRPAVAAAALVTALAAQTASANLSRFDDLFVFGDSLSDGGNAWLLTQTVPGLGFPPSPPIGPYAQRASNGPTAAEALAGLYGVAISPSVSGGTNYAVVGAATQTLTVPYIPKPPLPTPPGTIATSNFVPINYWQFDGTFPTFFDISGMADKGMQWQVSQFTAAAPAFDPARSLFLVWGGANDFYMFPSLAETVPPDQQVATLLGATAAAAGRIGSFVDQLYGAGARTFLVPNLPDLALTPDSSGLGALEKAALSGLTQYFNTALAMEVDARRSGYADITLVEFDTFSAFNAILADPAAFGLANVTDPCLGADLVTVCGDPSAYLFWDGVHPTAATSEIIAAQFYSRVEAAIPEPETYALVATGLLLLGWQARRRRALS
jgi:phospholipase/lecithinase/hemolysin